MASPAIAVIARAHRNDTAFGDGLLAGPATRRMKLEMTRTAVSMAAANDVFLSEFVFAARCMPESFRASR